MIDFDLREIEWHQANRKRQLIEFIGREEMPVWMEILGLYPARAAVEASKAQLLAMK